MVFREGILEEVGGNRSMKKKMEVIFGETTKQTGLS